MATGASSQEKAKPLPLGRLPQSEMPTGVHLKEKAKPLDSLTREELIEKVRTQEAHIKQLKNLLNNIQRQNAKQPSVAQQKRLAKQRPFDFTKFNTRHVALKIVYLGGDMDGYAVQEDTVNTVEGALFEALTYTKLIQSRGESNYHRCGRTDKGVSAFSQCISLDLRSNLLQGVGVRVPEGSTAHLRKGDSSKELDYVHILNCVLRPEIRVLAWAPVNDQFSARFSCTKRTYKYYFPKADLDIDAMRQAGVRLQGEHDFRNMCKMDVGNGVITYFRNIQHTDIQEISSSGSSGDGYSMCELTVVGKAFLWHQIRCVVAVLFMVGQGKETPDIIDELLDVEKHPQRPQYSMASELPLVLFDCEFEDVEWLYSAIDQEANIKHMQGLWTHQAVKTSMLKRMLEHLEDLPLEKSSPDGISSNSSTFVEFDALPKKADVTSTGFSHQLLCLIPSNYKVRTYKPLLERLKCKSLEQRIDHFVKRRKIHDPTVRRENKDDSLQTAGHSKCGGEDISDENRLDEDSSKVCDSESADDDAMTGQKCD